MRIHIVQKGDTLWGISQKYGVDFEELKSVNSQLSNPDAIMPGMKVKIPQGTKQVKKEAPQKATLPKEKPKKQTVQKELPKKEAPVETPYKDISPKPIPVIKEDEKIPVKQPAMEKPMMPMQPIQMNMPSIEQQMQNYYTTFHLPQMPMPDKDEEVSEEQTEESSAVKPEYHTPVQPYCPPMYPQLVHSDFYCCPPHPAMMMPQMPMQQPMYQQPSMPMHGTSNGIASPSMEGSGEGGGSDCGCGGGSGQQHTFPQQDQSMEGYGGFPPQGYPVQGQVPYGAQGYPVQGQVPYGAQGYPVQGQVPYGAQGYPVQGQVPYGPQGYPVQGQVPYGAQGYPAQSQPPYGPQGYPAEGWDPSQVYAGGYGQPFPMGQENMYQPMGEWNPEYSSQREGYPDSAPWRDDDLDES